MAYRVQRLRKAIYVYIVLRSTNGDVVKELERRLKVSDAVIKYLTVRLDEELKRQDKLKRHRERRAARRPRKTVAPPMAPAMTGAARDHGVSRLSTTEFAIARAAQSARGKSGSSSHYEARR